MPRIRIAALVLGLLGAVLVWMVLPGEQPDTTPRERREAVRSAGISPEPSGHRPELSVSVGPARIVTATREGVLLSDDAGESWHEPEQQPGYVWEPRALRASPARASRLYLATRGDGVFRSDDAGESWQPALEDLPGSIGAAPVAPVESLVLDPVDADVLYVALEVRGVFKSRDGGRSWSRVGDGLPSGLARRTAPWALAIDARDAERLLAYASWPTSGAHSAAAFFLSEDGAATWRRLETPAPEAPVRELHFSRDSESIGIATTGEGDFPIHR